MLFIQCLCFNLKQKVMIIIKLKFNLDQRLAGALPRQRRPEHRARSARRCAVPGTDPGSDPGRALAESLQPVHDDRLRAAGAGIGRSASLRSGRTAGADPGGWRDGHGRTVDLLKIKLPSSRTINSYWPLKIIRIQAT